MTPERSDKPLTLEDLRRLGDLAKSDRETLFRRSPKTTGLYADRLFAVALCQGGALHFIDRKNGINDLDVWSFYCAHSERQFPPRRRATADFGDPKFGTTADSPEFVGRRVDLIGRSLSGTDFTDPVRVLRDYLRTGLTKSARYLAQKAVVLIEPPELLGTIVWPEPHR